MQIKIDDRHTLNGDEYCYWVTRAVTSSKNGKDYEVRVTGYHNNLESLFVKMAKMRLSESTAKNLEEFKEDMEKCKEELAVMIKNIDQEVLNERRKQKSR